MVLKNKFYRLPEALLISIILLAGCTGLFDSKVDKNVSLESKQRAKVESVSKSIQDLDSEKVKVISKFAAGVDFSLSKSTNDDINIKVGKELNFRIISLAGEPSLDEKKEIWGLV